MTTRTYPRTLLFLCLLTLSFTMTSCELAGDLIKAGFWAGLTLGLLIGAAVLYLLRKITRR